METTTAVPAAIIMDRVRVKDLEHQIDQLRHSLQETEQKRRQAEVNANAAQKQARYLAAALRAVQGGSDREPSDHTVFNEGAFKKPDAENT